MKKIISLNLMVIMLFLCAFIQVNAEDNTHDHGKDYVEIEEDSNRRYIIRGVVPFFYDIEGYEEKGIVSIDAIDTIFTPNRYDQVVTLGKETIGDTYEIMDMITFEVIQFDSVGGLYESDSITYELHFNESDYLENNDYIYKLISINKEDNTAIEIDNSFIEQDDRITGLRFVQNEGRNEYILFKLIESPISKIKYPLYQVSRMVTLFEE